MFAAHTIAEIMKQTALTLLLTLFVPVLLMAQTIDTAWTKVYGGSADDCPGFGYDSRVNMDVNDAGDIFLLTPTFSADVDVAHNYGGKDAWVLKLNNAGDTIWTQVIGASGNEYASRIRALDDGGCLIAGYSYSDDGMMSDHHGTATEPDGFLARLTAEGDTLWVKSYGGSTYMDAIPGNDFFYDVIVLDNGNYLAIGQTNSLTDDLAPEFSWELFYTGWVCEITPEGEIVDVKRIYRPDHDENNPNVLFRIEQKDDNSGFLVMGESQHPMQSADKFWVMELDTAYDKVWEYTYGSDVQNISKAMCPTTNGGMLISGTIQGANGDVTGDFMGDMADVWIAEIDNQGNLVNQKIIGCSQGETIYDIQADGNNGYYLSGFIRGNDYYAHGDTTTGADFWLLRMNHELDTIWTWQNGGTDSDILTSMRYHNGQIITAGRTASNDSIIPYNHGSNDVWLAKFDFTSSILTQKGELPPKFYPNPASDLVYFSGAQYIRVYDQNGRFLVHKFRGSGHGKLSLRQLTPGMYIIELKTKNGEVFREKLIIN